MKKIIGILILILSLSVRANAQWYKLQPYNNPFATDSCDLITCPILSEIAGNGVIVYGAQTGVNSGKSGCLIGGGGENIMLSTDDLDTCKAGISAGGLGPGNIITINSKNDSSHFIIYTNGGVGTFLEFTSDNFKTTFVSNAANLSTPIEAFYYNIIPAGFSNNFIFFVRDFDYSTGPNSDTLLVYRANDSLTSITEFKITKYIYPRKLFFTSDSVGYMLCIYGNDSAKSVLATTADSGKTWTDSFLDSVNSITDFCFPTPSIGYLTESNGVIYKTTNAGATWSKINNPVTKKMNCVSFANSLLGYIGGNTGELYQTNNGGASWATVSSGTGYDISKLYTFGTAAYFINNHQDIYKNENPMGLENINAGSESVSVYPNPSNGTFSVAINNGVALTSSPNNYSTSNYELGIMNFVDVYNMLGQIVIHSFVIRNSQFVIDLSGQPNGIYFYRITSGSSAVTGKLIIAR